MGPTGTLERLEFVTDNRAWIWGSWECCSLHRRLKEVLNLDRARYYCHRVSCRGLWLWSWLFVAISEVALRAHINPLNLPLSGIRTRPLGWVLPRLDYLQYLISWRQPEKSPTMQRLAGRSVFTFLAHRGLLELLLNFP